MGKWGCCSSGSSRDLDFIVQGKIGGKTLELCEARVRIENPTQSQCFQGHALGEMKTIKEPTHR